MPGTGVDSPRLAAVASLVTRGARLVDVGTHHGNLPLHLLASGTASHCIATEVRASRLSSPLGELAGSDLPSGLELRFGDGLAPIAVEDRIDSVTITGLGARSMLRILDRGVDRVGATRLVLQPQTELASVRRWLVDHAFGIVGERMVVERGHYYVAIGAQRGAPVEEGARSVLDEEDLMQVGPRLLQCGDAVVRSFWFREVERLQAILRGATAGRSRSSAVARLDQARRILAALV